MSSSSGLLRMTLPAPDERLAIDDIVRGVSAFRQESAFTDVKQALVNYLAGQPVRFFFPVDLGAGTPFQRDVWEAASKIPRGELRSYQWVANTIGRPRAARAVGQALGANRLPIIIPCHRVVRVNGSLGGFSGGLHWKRKLIKLERAVLVP